MRIFNRSLSLVFVFMIGTAGSSSVQHQGSDKQLHLIVLDPGHFHAALVQKSTYPGVDPKVKVFAPAGSDLQAHLKLIESYNTRTENPTNWKEEVYSSPDFYPQMLKAQPGSLVILAGNNQKKSDYISRSIAAGFHVLADKPMAIDEKSFQSLRLSFEKAKANNVLLYDVMTERYTIHSILQRALSQEPALFGQLVKGTKENPAVVKESVHHFFKEVSGMPLIRPSWYYDTRQEGEGIVDVTTHMVDLIQWQCFPEQAINYQKEIQLLSAKRWPSLITAAQFHRSTLQNNWPSFLTDRVKDEVLSVYANGEMNYTLRHVHAKVAVRWDFEAPAGSGDTHYSLMRGTKANLVIRQGEAQNFKPVLYIESVKVNNRNGNASLRKAVFDKYEQHYPGLKFKTTAKGWEVVIPPKYVEGHEAQFAMVTRQFLAYLKDGKLPTWEVPNMLAKYYTTTSALALATR